MSRNRIVGILLLIVSAAMMIYRSETTYEHLEASSKWMRSFGAGFAPWIIGLIVAAIKEAWARMRKQPHSFTGSTLWGTGVVTAIVVIGLMVGSAKSQDLQSVHDDAMVILGVGAWVPGVAAYCQKYVEPNKELLSAVIAWNQRHKKELQKVIQALKWAGGLSKDQRKLIDRLAFKMLKQEVEAEPDKPAYCQKIAMSLKQGILDLASLQETSQAIKRIMALKLK